MSKFFLDSEFMEDGKTIEVLSLGMEAENGRELYCINDEADRSKANSWVMENVVPFLDNLTPCNPDYTRVFRGGPTAIGLVVLEFVQANCTKGPKPEFWGYFADYDWVAFCQLYGRMVDLPPFFPMYCNDVKQLSKMLMIPHFEKDPSSKWIEHHALCDARDIRRYYNICRTAVEARQLYI